MSFGIHYSDMCTVKELKEPIVKQAEIEYKIDDTHNALEYINERIEEYIKAISEAHTELKGEEDSGLIYALKLGADEDIDKLNILLNVEEKLKGRVQK